MTDPQVSDLMRDQNGTNSLKTALGKGHFEISQIIIERMGRNTFPQTRANYTEFDFENFFFASVSGDLKTFQLISNIYGDVNPPLLSLDNETPLHIASALAYPQFYFRLQ